MEDPRAADVAEAERLLAAVAADGAAQLPALSAAELCVLCEGGQALIEHGEYRWWYALAEAERRTLTTAVLDFLSHRGLLRPPASQRPEAKADDDGSVRLPMAPALAMIVAARQRPGLIAVGTDPDQTATGAPRMYGLSEEGQPLRALVAELVTGKVTKPFGALHRFVLLSPHKAGTAFTAWAAGAGRGGRRSKDQARTVDVYRHAADAGLTRDRMVITSERGALRVTRQRQDASMEPSVSCERHQLAHLLTGVLIGDERP